MTLLDLSFDNADFEQELCVNSEQLPGSDHYPSPWLGYKSFKENIASQHHHYKDINYLPGYIIF